MPNSVRTISFFAALFVSLGLATSVAAQTIRVAVPQLPVFQGVPFGRPFGGNPEAFTIPALFEGLTYLNAKGELQPLLAESWERITETHWRFKLRQGVRFSNGAPFNADVVKRNLDFVNEETSAAYSVVQQIAHISGISARDTHTVDIFTRRPDPFLPQLMSIFYMVEPGQWERLGSTAFGRDPVGTGPFRVTEWTDTVVRFEAADMSWRQAKSEALDILSVNNPTTRLQGLLSGDLHVAFSMGPDDRAVIEGEGHTVFVRATPGVITLPFNLTVESPLRDIRVRQALNHAVDNAMIVRAILGDEAVVPTQFTSHMAFGFDPDYAPYPYDVARARALLNEAGYGEGFDLPVEVAQGLSSYSASIYQLIAAQLAGVGVEMEIRPVPIARYMGVLMQGQWNGTMAINLDYAVDPSMDALVPIDRHSCAGAISWYCDPAITPLLAAARSTVDIEERLALTRRVVRRQTEQAPGLLLWEKIRYDAASKQVRGFVHDLNFIHYDRLAPVR